MKISVIVIIHNEQGYLRECLDSVIGQTFHDIEILCIYGTDAGNTADVLKEYATKDNRIRIFNTQNTSYGYKVNEGVKQAQGQYISILRSDDIYSSRMVEKLCTIIEKYHPDFLDTDYMDFIDIADSRRALAVELYQNGDYDRFFINRKHLEKMKQIPHYLSGMLKKEFLIQNKLRMNEVLEPLFANQSFIFLSKVLSQTAYHINEPLYMHRKDSSDAEKVEMTVDKYEHLKSELEKREITDEEIWKNFYIWKYEDLYTGLTQFDEAARDGLWRRTLKELDKDRKVLVENQAWKYSWMLDILMCRRKQEIIENINDRYEAVANTLCAQEWFFDHIKSGPIVIFGCGKIGKALLNWFEPADGRILCFTDNSRSLWNTECKGYKVLPPKEAAERYPHAVFVVANKLGAEEIKSQLIGIGVEPDKILVYNSLSVPKLYERKAKTREEQQEEITRAVRKGLINWYDFREGKSALYIGEETDALPEVLQEKKLNVTCLSIERIGQCTDKFDYIICIETLEQYPDPLEILKSLKKLLKPAGKLLLGMNNRYGLRYFCGDRDPYTERNFDGIENYRTAYAKKEDTFKGRCYSQAEMRELLKEAGFVNSRFYSVLTDLQNPVLLYGEDFLPNEDLANRIFPTYNYPETVFMREESLYTGLVDNGMFHSMANAYLVESSLDGSCSDVLHVTSSMTRDQKNALITTIRRSSRVEKRAAYPEGQSRIEKLLEHGKDLALHGVHVVDAVIENNVYHMPYIEEETGQLYLKRLFKKNREEFLHAMDSFRDIILSSSEIVKEDTGDGMGAILKKGYLDMVPLNSFYRNGTFVFFDQEFCEENYPANALIWRMVATFYAGDRGAMKLLPMDELLERYGLKENLPYWQRMEWLFLNKLRRDNELHTYYEKCRCDDEVVNTNRSRINYSADDYQRIFIDIFYNADTRKLVLFGAGNFTKRFLNLYGQDYPVYAIVDNNPKKWGKELDDMDGAAGADGIKVQPPEILRHLQSGEYKVLICIKNYLSAMRQLESMGVSEYSVYDPAKNYPRKRHPIVQTYTGNGQAAVPKKYHTGYIAGVFDLFHIGHLNMFKRAKEQCDYLIVGVVSDEGVRDYKGTEPFVPFEERIEMVRSCRYVDEAVEIPLRFGGTRDAWRLHHFDCQFSGSDYIDNPAWLKEKEFLEAHGADMVFFPYTQQTSSSKIKALIEQSLL